MYYESLYRIPPFENIAELGHCSDGEYEEFSRFLNRLPMNRAGSNLFVLRARFDCDCFVQRLVLAYRGWLKAVWASESLDNRDDLAMAIEASGD